MSPLGPITAVDLFAGPGGWSTAAAHLGIREVGLEWDTAALETAQAAGHLRYQADIAATDPREFTGDHLLGLIASPPCQGFTLAGLGKGRADSLLLLEYLHALTAAPTVGALAQAMDALRHRMTDPRSLLALEPLRWALALRPTWLAWEQVPTVLPLWEACADVLRSVGYSVATGNLHAEQYGVPQTRKRAILAARAPWFTEEDGPATLPPPTHSRYHSRDPERLDDEVAPWVTMAEALSWGMTHRPYPTVATGTAAGGTDPAAIGGSGARRTIRNEMMAGRWTGLDGYGRDPREWTPTAAVPGDTSWSERRPSPTIVGSFAPDVVAAPGYRKAGDGPRQSQPGSIRVTVEEAATLQSFPPGYPWQGSKSARYRQVGDAVPPLLARAILTEVAGPLLSAPPTTA